MTTDEIYKTLVSLGYNLLDRGTYWQTNAIFRNGDNQTALQIYKDTGVWRDFVNNSPPSRFETLVIKTLGTTDHKVLKKYLKEVKSDYTGQNSAQRQEKLVMEEVYSEDSLKKLLPHYDFYNQKGISSPILKKLRGGLATQGQMYQRYVFPIYTSEGKIHGFSGRDMSNKEGRPKWKHIGRKSGWVYPAHVPSVDASFMDIMESAKEIIIIESIGDLLALHEQGIPNALVAFGVDIGPSLISFLVQLNPEKIIISFNNDCDKKENRGFAGAIKNYLKLLSHFDYSKIFLCLPPQGDFGDMEAEEFNGWLDKVNSLNSKVNSTAVLKASATLADSKQLSKRLIKNMNMLSEALSEQ